MTPSKVKILFIGNSFTTRNDVPALLAGLAADGGRGVRIESEVVAAGGASLRRHLNGGKAAELLKTSTWDYVVLQEQSTLPIKNRRRMHENIRDADELIRDSKAQTVLYMTWARQKTPETQRDLTTAYEEIGEEIGAVVVPVGRAWERLLESHPEVILHDADGSHPSLTGSYLAACVFQWSLFGKPVGIPASVSSIPENEMDIVHRVAEQTARGQNP